MQDILQDIHQYSDNFTISQVVKFFERKGLIVTKSMIQNYVRDGILPPPVNKRHYTHKHLTTLALIIRLKTVFEFVYIKAVLVPLTDSEGIPLEVYRQPPETLALMIQCVDLKDEAVERLRKLEGGY